MKKFLEKIIAAGALALACYGLQAAPISVPTQTPQLVIGTNLPAVINAATVSNTTSVLKLQPGVGASLQWRFNASADTANTVVYFKPRVDGTNDTSTLWTWIIPATSTTDVFAWTNWSAATLAGLSDLSIVQITNAHATAVVTNKGFVLRPADR